MSYDLYICVPPLPRSDKGAWALLEDLCAEEGPQSALLADLFGLLAKRYPCGSTDEESDDFVWSVSPLFDEVGHRVAQLPIRYSAASEVAPFVIASAIGIGLDVFEPQIGWIFRHDGITGLSLTIEGKPQLSFPTMDQLNEVVESLTSDGGPSFLVLERECGDYAQVAGGKGVFTAEWREYSRKSFRHWVAGNPSHSAFADVQIATNGGQLLVKENERLSAEQVQKILAAYAKCEKRPDEFTWRETTENFN